MRTVLPQLVTAAAVAVCSAVFACGGSPSGDGDGDGDGRGGGGTAAGGSGSSAGGTAQGGGLTGSDPGGASGSGGKSPTAGASSASGTAGAASAPPGSCSPGFTAKGATLYPFPFDTCGAIAGLEGVDAGFRDLTLPDGPVGPGQVYAFSAEMNAAAGTFELYGATEKCGKALELLDTVTIDGPGILCHQVSPKDGTYSHLIWVWRVAVEQGATTFCMGGMCPNR
jgi:hypothetical protein